MLFLNIEQNWYILNGTQKSVLGNAKAFEICRFLSSIRYNINVMSVGCFFMQTYMILDKIESTVNPNSLARSLMGADSPKVSIQMAIPSGPM